MMRSRRVLRGTCLALGAAASLALASAAAGAPSEGVHELVWRVHVDVLDPGAGEDLAYYQQLIETRSAQADVMLRGHQGPADAGCCVRLDPV